MAAVTIDSGPIAADDRLHDVPKHKWHDLMLARRQHLEIRLNYDCRCLVEYVNDAEMMFLELGFASAEAMIRDGYNLKPEEVALAIEWLKLNPSEHNPVPLKIAVKLGKRGRPKKGQEKGGDSTFFEGVTKNTKAHWLARLDRDGHDELAAKVRSGEMKANAAAIEAGFRKKLTPIERVLKLLPKLTPTERRHLRARLDELMKLRGAA
jgi:hypothetical protein